MQAIKNESILKLLLSEYGFSNPDIEMMGKNTRAAKITTTNQTYLLRTYDLTRNEEKIKNDVALLQYLEASNYPAPRLIKTRTGEEYVVLSEGICYITTYIEGTHPQISEEVMIKLGELTAKLHLITKNKPYTNVSLWNQIEEQKLLQEQIEKYKDKNIAHWDIIPELEKAFVALPDFSLLPQVIIHTDIGGGNIIQSENEDLVFIDWDDAGLGAAVIDIGYVFAHICLKVKDEATEETELIWYPEIARAFIKGYSTHRQLTNEEKDAVIEAMYFCVLTYVFLFWIPQIGMHNWNRYLFIKQNKENIVKGIFS